jgi:hypothetical protein
MNSESHVPFAIDSTPTVAYRVADSLSDFHAQLLPRLGELVPQVQIFTASVMNDFAENRETTAAGEFFCTICAGNILTCEQTLPTKWQRSQFQRETHDYLYFEMIG